MKPYREELANLVKEVVGVADDEFLDRPCGSGECALGNLVADALLTSVSMIRRISLLRTTLV